MGSLRLLSKSCAQIRIPDCGRGIVKFVISGITGYRNRGVEALASSTIAGLEAIYPGSSFVVLTGSPDYDQERMPVSHVKHMQDDFLSLKSRTAGYLSSQSKLMRKISESRANIESEIRKCDALIISGGDIFSSDYGAFSMHLKPIELARRYEKPVILLGHSVGKFKERSHELEWRRGVRSVELVTVRERISEDYLNDYLNVSSRVVRVADVAFDLPILSDLAINLILRHHHLVRDEFIALSISQGISTFANSEGSSHFRAWIEQIEHLLANTQYDIALIPHVQERNSSNDDRLIATKILKHFEYNPRIKGVFGDYSAIELKSIISCASFVIAERMHAGIAGLSTGVPTIMIAYSIKSEGVAQDFIGKEHNGPSMVLPLKDFLNNGGVKHEIIDAIKNRHEMRSLISSRLPEVKESCRLNYQLVKEYLK